MPDSNPIPKEDRVIVRANQSDDYSLRLEPSGKRVRAVVGGVAIADSTRVQLVFESKRLPIYYFPIEDVRMDLVQPNGQVRDLPPKGGQVQLSVTVGDRTIANAGWLFEDPAPVAAELKGMVAFYWSRLDQWFEEDDEVYEHPRDPYHRVDVLHSSRHVEVVVLGETVADTHRPRLLFETGLPTRYYIPRADVRGELLVPSPTTSVCPYKGDARVLLDPRRRHHRQGPRLVLPPPDPGVPEDREPALLLQRAGRRDHRRRRGGREAGDAVVEAADPDPGRLTGVPGSRRGGAAAARGARARLPGPGR